ncbi:MAG TPA: hypothetical protein VKA10_03135, partial [Prolixibacteraceae bacterium]|nr:hypothetical protein [Prolixibacteraceae bacterium]
MMVAKRQILNRNSILLYVIFLLISFVGKGQEKVPKRKITVLPVPAIGYSPETKTYVGAVALFTIKNLTDTLTRTSNADFEFNYTWNKQVIIETGWNYFTPGEEWFSTGL